MRGTGFLGAHAGEVYRLATDDLYLVGTSEVALAGYHSDEILDLSAGPRRYLSLIHISEPTRRTPISYAVFCLKKKKSFIGMFVFNAYRHIFFVNDTATTEIYTSLFVGSVRCV